MPPPMPRHQPAAYMHTLASPPSQANPRAHLQRGGARALAVAGLQHEQHAVLHRELAVLLGGGGEGARRGGCEMWTGS